MSTKTIEGLTARCEKAARRIAFNFSPWLARALGDLREESVRRFVLKVLTEEVLKDAEPASSGWSYDMATAPRDGSAIFVAAVLPPDSSGSVLSVVRNPPDGWTRIGHPSLVINEPYAWRPYPKWPEAPPVKPIREKP